MVEETLRQQLRKKVIDMKPEAQGFYTETYNIVSVLVRLTPKAPAEIHDRIERIYLHPSPKYQFSLSRLEDIYYKYRGDLALKIRSAPKIDLYDIKEILDKVRRNMLFYLALLDEPTKDYNIILEEMKKGNSL